MKCPALPSAARRMTGAAAVVLVARFGAGCGGGQSGAEVTMGGGDGPGDPNPGAVECQVDAECRDSALAELEAFSTPVSQSFAVSGSSCQAFDVILEDRQVSGPACTCDLAGGGGRTLGPVGIGCSVTGRAGECLWSDSEFAGCDVTDSHSCEAACAELAQRLTADAARSFQTELVYAGCQQGNCETVVSIDGQCYANRSYQQGKSYDCALGAEAILAANTVASQPPQRDELPENGTPFYLPGTNATVQLTVSQDYWGTARGALGFGVGAQFFDLDGRDVHYGDVLDPLDGLDDCTVVRQSTLGTAADVRLRSVDRALLRDGDREFALEEFRSSSDSYYSYLLDLGLAGAQPRFGGSYGFSASGGTFGASVEIGDILLPDSLSSAELETNSHFERGPLALTWTGRSDNALQLSLDITPQIDDFNGAYHIECWMADDGAFTVPATVLEAAPDGFVTATLRRARREVVSSGGKSLQTLAEVTVNHRFVFGPSCDGSALMAACQRSAETIRARYLECSDLEPPPLEQLCPDYLASACGSCPEYFDCLAAGTTCESTGLNRLAGCGCPR